MDMTDEAFLQLWKEFNGPLRELKGRLARSEARASRAEVTGAVELVSALPPAGQPGRLVYRAGGGLVGDLGAAWGVLCPQAVCCVQTVLAASTASTSTEWEDADPANIPALTLTPAGSRVLVLATLMGSQSTTTAAATGRFDLSDGTRRAGDETNGLARTSILSIAGTNYALPFNGTLAGLFTDLVPGQPITFRIQWRTTDAANTVFITPNRLIQLLGLEL